MFKVCVICGREFAGRADARYCSGACRMVAFRNRNVTDGQGESTAAAGPGELQAAVTGEVTDGPGAGPVGDLQPPVAKVLNYAQAAVIEIVYEQGKGFTMRTLTKQKGAR